MSSIIRKPAGQRARAKQQSLERILDAGARRLCEEGLSGAAIAPVMNDAGLTHGAFYAHFQGKDQLAAAAFEHAVSRRTGQLIGSPSDKSWGERLRRIAKRYLTRAHRDDPAEGCAFAALTSDAVRAPDAFRAAYQKQFTDLLAAISQPFDSAEAGEKRRDDAIVLMALCVGGMSLSRAVADREFSDRILRVCRNAFAPNGDEGGIFAPPSDAEADESAPS